MPGIIHPDFERLKSLFADLNPGSDEAVGLLCASEGYHSPYDATPAGAQVIASTGGDGVHFSFLPNEFSEPDDWPVIMTVPMQFDRPNMVVGSGLREFLALGLYAGFFVLEQLVYDEDEMLELLERNRTPENATGLMAATLEAIAETFSIQPWDDHRQRLAWLQSNISLPVEN